ncbi:MAG: glycosyltransferase, partial [Planctomycetota bacterium]
MEELRNKNTGRTVLTAQDTARPRVLHVVTSPLGLGLMRGQPEFLCQVGFDVKLASAPDPLAGHPLGTESAQWFSAPLEREIAPLKDLRAFWRLCRLLRRVRPSITNVSMPKAGLLGGLAAWLMRVPCRFYTLRGLRLETARGLKRCVLLLVEHITCRCAHRVICVSESVRQKAVALGVVDVSRTVVLSSGSSNG